jgi:F-type H+-transporting ATPase subunit b
MTAGSESWLSWVFKFFNFAVLLAIVVKFAGKPLKNYLVNRHKGVKERIEEGERMFREAEALKKEYENRLAKLDEEIDAFKKVVIEETEKEKQKILEEARGLALKIKEQARLTYEQEIREAKGKIKEEIARLTVERAEKLIAERFSRSDNDKMVEEFIEKLRSLN